MQSPGAALHLFCGLGQLNIMCNDWSTQCLTFLFKNASQFQNQRIKGTQMTKKSWFRELPLRAKWFFAVAAVSAVSMCASSNKGSTTSKPDMNATYPAPWSSAIKPEVTRALLAAGVTGCGYLEHRVSTRSRTEYLVACSRNGQSWLVYMVWPAINEVMGPYKAPKGVKMPGEQ